MMRSITLPRRSGALALTVLTAWTSSAASPLPPPAVGPDFGIGLYRQLADTSAGNLVISPDSLSMALAMTAAGARGETLAEIRQALGVTLEDAAWHRASAAARNRLAAATDGGPITLSVANSLWPDAGFALTPTFTTLLREAYGAERTTVSYGQPETARQAINDWVARETQQTIQELMPPGSISALTRLTLVNAIYFKGTWQDPFDPGMTRPAPFHQGRGEPIQAPFMMKKARRGYLQDADCQVVSLDYKGGALAMWIVVPRDLAGLGAVVSSLSAERLARWGETLASRETVLFLPRFKMTYATPLNTALKSLGIRSVFDPAKADLSGMAGGPGDLYLQAAMHKAFIEVNEVGTEAAAATGASFGVTSMPAEPPAIVRADRPFLFLIRDKASGAILFLGRCVHPRYA